MIMAIDYRIHFQAGHLSNNNFLEKILHGQRLGPEVDNFFEKL